MLLAPARRLTTLLGARKTTGYAALSKPFSIIRSISPWLAHLRSTQRMALSPYQTPRMKKSGSATRSRIEPSR